MPGIRMTLQLILAVLFVVLCMNSMGVEAVTCHLCTSLNPNCNDPFKSSTATCPSNYGCYKVKGSPSDVQVVQRGCWDTTINKNECRKETYDGVTGTVCVCTGDYCNSSPPSLQRAQGSLFTLLVGTLVVTLIRQVACL